jgi:hypothetical protein
MNNEVIYAPIYATHNLIDFYTVVVYIIHYIMQPMTSGAGKASPSDT